MINRAIKQSGRIDVHVISTDSTDACAHAGESERATRAERTEVGPREGHRLGARSGRRAAVRRRSLAVQGRDRRARHAASAPAASGRDRDARGIAACARGLCGRLPLRGLVLHRADAQLAVRARRRRARARGVRRGVGPRQRARRSTRETLRAAREESGRDRGVGGARVRHGPPRRGLAPSVGHRASRRARPRIGRGLGADAGGMAGGGVVRRACPDVARGGVLLRGARERERPRGEGPVAAG